MQRIFHIMVILFIIHKKLQAIHFMLYKFWSKMAKIKNYKHEVMY